MTLDEMIAVTIRTYGASLEVRQDGRQFRAGFANDWDSSLPSECRPTPGEAIRRFHEKLVERAQKGADVANEHLRSLTSTEPKSVSPEDE